MRVRYLIEVEALVEQFENWDEKATLEGLRTSAARTAESWQILLKQGATEPKVLRSTMTVKSITIPTDAEPSS